MSINNVRSLGQHIRDVFTLADSRPLLTDPDPSSEQRAKIAESCRFYFTTMAVFAIAWAVISVREIMRNQGDDAILGYIGLAVVLGLAYSARTYYLRYRNATRPPQ